MPIATELNINTSATAVDMANAMFGDGITVVSATYSGDATSSGTYTGGSSTLGALSPSDEGVILSTGQASDITNSSGTTDTNVAPNTSTDTLGGIDGDADLNAVAGMATFDGAVLEATFIPVGDVMTMQLVFSSEEYLEYVGGGVNDAVGVWVNGTYVPLTLSDESVTDVTIDTINATTNSNLYVDNPATVDAYNTEMDGSTVVLSFTAPVNSGALNTIKIGIADGGDAEFDSNLLIMADSVQTVSLANNDQLVQAPSSSNTYNILANDYNSDGNALTVTHINNQAVTPGDTVILPTGEQITLNADGTVTIVTDGDVGTNVFTYSTIDSAGNPATGYISLETSNEIVEGTSGSDLITGTYLGDPDGDLIDANDNALGNNDDLVLGFEGNDVIQAGDGNDQVYGGDGNDQVYGETGNDILYGEAGDDDIYGGNGNDEVYGGAGNDSLVGGSGDDLLDGQDGDDLIDGEDGTDVMDGGDGDDTFLLDDTASGGNDTVIGGETGETAGDTLYADENTDSWTFTWSGEESGTATANTSGQVTDFAHIENVIGSGNNDSFDASATTLGVNIDGADGEDAIIGGSGDDTLNSGTGADTVTGGAGNDSIDVGVADGAIDTLVFSDGDGDDSVTGFEAPNDNGDGTWTGVDQFDVSGLTSDGGTTPVTTADVTITDTNGDGTGDAILTFPGGESITLVGIAPTAISSPFALEAMGIPISGDDIVDGTAGDDYINGSYFGDPEGDLVDGNDNTAGNNQDTIMGYAGNDILCGAEEDDTIFGGTGNDQLDGEAGNDTLLGEAGDDTIFGGTSINATPSLSAVTGSSGSFTGTWGNGNFTHTTTTTGATLTYPTAASGLNGYWVGDNGGEAEIHTHTFSQEANAGEIRITAFNSGDVTTIYIDGVALDLNEAIANNLVTMTTTEGNIYVDASGNLQGTSASDIATLTINVPFTSIGIEHDGGSSGTVYELDVDTNPVADTGAELINGGTGDDTILAMGGDDTIQLTDNFGNDVIEGGEHAETNGDTLDLSATTTGVTVDLTSQYAEVGTVSNGTATASFTQIENIILGAGDDTVVLADGSGTDSVQGFEAPIDNGDGTFTGQDQLDVSGLTSDGGTTPVNVTDVTITDTNGDGTGDAILTFPGGESITLVGVQPSEIDNAQALAAMGIPLAPDYFVDGTAGDDLIDTAFVDDPDGDMVDANDAADGSDNDQIRGGFGNDIVNAGDGDDYVSGGPGNDTLYGEAGNDELDGDDGDDTLYGGIGNDTLNGGAGTDTMDGGADADILIVGDGSGATNTAIGGETGTDDDMIWMAGFASDATITFTGDESGTGTLTDGSAVTFSEIEQAAGGNGDDTIDASVTTTGKTIWANGGNDTVLGGDGNDVIHGGDGNDDIVGGAGNDVFYGDGGHDTMDGSDGNDVFYGGTGNDIIIGDIGNDIIESGAGNDTINFADGDGADTITDFDFTDTDIDGFTDDQIDVSGLTDGDGNPVNVFDVTVTDTVGDGSGDAILQFPNGESITLTGVDPATLDLPTLHAMGIPCFTAGTLIDTPSGTRAIEHLSPGDHVLTADGAPQPVIWIGKRSFGEAELKADRRLRPVVIREGALGNRRELRLSPQHRVALGPQDAPTGFVPACWLAQDGGNQFHVARDREAVTYIQLLLPRHAVVRAEGVAVESFYPGPQGLAALDPWTKARLFLQNPAFGTITSRADAEKVYGPLALPEIKRRDMAGQLEAARNTKAGTRNTPGRLAS